MAQDSDQDSDQDTTASSDSTDSSAWDIQLEHCVLVLVTAGHCYGPLDAVVQSYAGSARALLRHLNQVYNIANYY